MSIIREESIRVVAQSLGIEHMKEEVAGTLAPDIEFHLRELIQDAMKFCSHAKRETLSTTDINDALRIRNMESLYGFSTPKPINFIQADACEGLYVMEDKILDLSDILNMNIPPCPPQPTFSMHWFAVDGVQPRIPENEINEEEDSLTSIKENIKEKVQVKPLVKHVVSEEMQLYYMKVSQAMKEQDFQFQQAVFNSLFKDPGLHQLLPYFSRFVFEEVKRSILDLPVLSSLMRMCRCLFLNPHLHFELYLHQFLPSILTCAVGKRLCRNPADNHWSLREYAAKLVREICDKYGDVYENLQPRVSKTFHEAFTNPERPFTTQYGAILGMMHLGPLVMELLLFPALPQYLSVLEPVLSFNNRNQVQRMEAHNCFGALQRAAGEYFIFKSSSKDVIGLNDSNNETIALLNNTFGESLIPYACSQTQTQYQMKLVL